MNKNRIGRFPPLLALTCLLVSTLSAQAGAPPACPLGAGWVFEPGFSDEFNAPRLDPEKWWDFNPAWHGRKPAYFDRANVRVGDGHLQLLARTQNPAEVTPENRARGHDLFTAAGLVLRFVVKERALGHDLNDGQALQRAVLALQDGRGDLHTADKLLAQQRWRVLGQTLQARHQTGFIARDFHTDA